MHALDPVLCPKGLDKGEDIFMTLLFMKHQVKLLVFFKLNRGP